METYLHHCAFSSLLISCTHSSSLLPCSDFSIKVNFSRSVQIVRCMMLSVCDVQIILSMRLIAHSISIVRSDSAATCKTLCCRKGRCCMTHTDRLGRLEPRKAGAYALSDGPLLRLSSSS
jgi:hypothetical protein